MSPHRTPSFVPRTPCTSPVYRRPADGRRGRGTCRGDGVYRPPYPVHVPRLPSAGGRWAGGRSPGTGDVQGGRGTGGTRRPPARATRRQTAAGTSLACLPAFTTVNSDSPPLASTVRGLSGVKAANGRSP